jgi:hypothetical protein
LNDQTDLFQFTDNEIKQYIVKLPEVERYKIITANSPELLARRIRYFLHLNPEWIISGGVAISPKAETFTYRDNINWQHGTVSVRDNYYHQTLIKPTQTTVPATAAGGSIRQNSRKIRVQRKKRD